MSARQQRIQRHDVTLILYALQRKWGTPADLYKVSVGSPDFVSGGKGVSRTLHHIPLFVTSSVTSTRKFEYDIGYLAANKNFTYGGFYEPGDRLGFIAASDVPSLIEITQEDYMIINGQRYNMQRIVELDFREGWYLHLRRIKNQKRYAIHEKYLWSRVSIDQDSGGEL